MGIYGLRADLAQAIIARNVAAKQKSPINWCLANIRIERMELAEWEHAPTALRPLQFFE